MPVPRKIRWYRRWWVILLGLLAIFILSIIGFDQYQDWRYQKKVDELAAQLDRSEPYWRLEKWFDQFPAVSEEDNLALAGWQLNKKYGPETVELVQAFERASDAPVHLYSGPDLEVLRRHLAFSGDLLPEVQRLLRLKQGRFPPIQVENPSFRIWNVVLDAQQQIRGTAHLLARQAHLWAQDGRADDALEACRAILHLGNAFESEPFMLSQLIGCAVHNMACTTLQRVLAHTEPSEAALIKMQAGLLQAAEVPFWERAVKGERATIDQSLKEIQSGKYTRKDLVAIFNNNGRLSMGDLSSYLRKFIDQVRIWVHGTSLQSIPKERYHALCYYNELLTVLQHLPDERWDKVKEIGTRYSSESAMVNAVGGGLAKVYEADQKRRSMLRIAAALVAAERFRRAQGRLPNDWKEIVPKYYPEIPIDHYDGKPMRWKNLSPLSPSNQGLGSVIIYMVWIDKKDNGGMIHNSASGMAASDAGMQIWAVPERRQKPVVEKAQEQPSISPPSPAPSGSGK